MGKSRHGATRSGTSGKSIRDMKLKEYCLAGRLSVCLVAREMLIEMIQIGEGGLIG